MNAERRKAAMDFASVIHIGVEIWKTLDEAEREVVMERTKPDDNIAGILAWGTGILELMADGVEVTFRFPDETP